MSFKDELHKSWKEVLDDELSKSYIKDLEKYIFHERAVNTIYPSKEHTFRALNETPLNNLKVVILGQDPYHGLGQANGLCFSVNPGVKFPPSLRNIFKEMKNDVNLDIPFSGDLSSWAQQGVLLLNAVLTVKAEKAASHKNRGWEIFTDAIIQKISDSKENVVFLLWGNYAKDKVKNIDLSKHHVLTSAHPSPLSAHNGFFGNNHFSKTNQLLKSFNKAPINWNSLL